MSNRSYVSTFWFVMPSVGLCLVWYAHVLLTMAGDPLGLTVDIVLWVIGSVLKITTIVFTALVAAKLLASMARSVRQTLLACIVLASSGAVLLALGAGSREAWAPALSNDAIKYYSIADETSHIGMNAHWDKWKTDWQRGYVLFAETVLLLMVVVVLGIVGYFFGETAFVSVPAVYFGVFASLAAYSLITDWYHSDYDEFHGDIVASALLLDHVVFFVAIDPYTTIASLVYLGFTLVSFLLLGTKAARVKSNRNSPH